MWTFLEILHAEMEACTNTATFFSLYSFETQSPSSTKRKGAKKKNQGSQQLSEKHTRHSEREVIFQQHWYSFTDNSKGLYTPCAKGKLASIIRMCCNSVYLAVQFFHSDQVQGLEWVSCWGDEIKAYVDPGVMVVKQWAFDLQFFLKIVFKLSVDVVNDGLVTVETGKEKLWGFISNIWLFMHSSLMNIKVNMNLSLGIWTQTVMFSITARSVFMPRSHLKDVQLTATRNLCSACGSLADTNHAGCRKSCPLS